MSKRETVPLRLELLRMRGQIERAEVAAALIEFKAGARRIGTVAAAVSSLGGALAGAGRRGPVGLLLDAARGRAIWAPLALAAVRALRRHPAAAVALTVGAAALAGWWFRRRNEPPAPPPPARD